MSFISISGCYMSVTFDPEDNPLGNTRHMLSLLCKSGIEMISSANIAIPQVFLSGLDKRWLGTGSHARIILSDHRCVNRCQVYM